MGNKPHEQNRDLDKDRKPQDRQHQQGGGSGQQQGGQESGRSGEQDRSRQDQQNRDHQRR